MAGAAISTIDAGAVWESVEIGSAMIDVRYERCPAGWSARFTLRDPLAADVAVVHRLVAPSFREARRAVPAAVAFLNGAPLVEGKPLPAPG